MSDLERFDAVIVGSGFGGSVMTFRLAGAGMKVCLLERGKAYPPGSFPRGPIGLAKNFWDPSKELYGMYDIWSFHRMDAVAASALGGGSLIYASVLLRKDPQWFDEAWRPITRETLDPHYERVENMLRPQRYPRHAPAYRSDRVEAFHEAAKRLGREAQLAPVAVYYANEDANPVPGAPLEDVLPDRYGRPRQTCTLCAECILGCNAGAKNTLDLTYVSAAEAVDAPRTAAAVRTLCEVKGFEPHPSGRGWLVDYVQHDAARACATPYRIAADRLILSAGSLGSTYLLLRMKEKLRRHGVVLSDELGTRVGGNGDMLMLAMNCRTPDGDPRYLEPSFGPTITSYVRLGDELDGDGGSGRGGYIEDAALPDLVNWLLEFGWPPTYGRRLARFGWTWLKSWLRGDTDMSAEVAAILGKCTLSGTSMPLLGMGRDVADGRMSLDKKDERWLALDWKMEGSRGFFNGLMELGKSLVTQMGGDFAANPTSKLGRVMTVHPLGGCPIGRDASQGVVDDWGRVYGAKDLWVADGAVMPGPVGPNPSLTIAALADRFAEGIILGAS